MRPIRHACSVLVVALALTALAPSVAARAATGPAVVAETDLSRLRNPSVEWVSKNQRRAWWNSSQGRWDGVLPAAAPPAAGTSDWWVAADVAGSAPRYLAEVATSSSARLDAFWDDSSGQLYVLTSHPSTTRFDSFRYDAATDTYTPVVVDATVPGITGSGDSQAVVHRSPNGFLWAAVADSSPAGVWVSRSTDGGATWAQPVSVATPTSSGQVGLTDFPDGGQVRVAVAAAEDGSVPDSRYRFLHVGQDDPGWAQPANWVNESDLLPPFEAGEHADDEMSVTRDGAGNVYLATEAEPGAGSRAAGAPQVVLYRRTPAGQWSAVTVQAFTTNTNNDRKRPSVAVDDDSGELYVFSTAQSKQEISYRRAPLGDLDQLATATWEVAFEADGSKFRNLLVPRHPVDGTTGLFVMADNIIDATVWGNRVTP